MTLDWGPLSRRVSNHEWKDLPNYCDPDPASAPCKRQGRRFLVPGHPCIALLVRCSEPFVVKIQKHSQCSQYDIQHTSSDHPQVCGTGARTSRGNGLASSSNRWHPGTVRWLLPCSPPSTLQYLPTQQSTFGVLWPQ